MTRSSSETGVVRDVARGGDAAVETPVGIVLASGALQGERVRVQDIVRRGGALRGTLAEVLEASRFRRKPPCPLSEQCGGCPLMHAEPREQQRIKTAFVEQALRRSVGPDHPVVQWVSSRHELAYRRRARLFWRKPHAGYRRRASRDLVDVSRCPVLAPPLEEAWSAFRHVLLPVLVGAGELHLALAREGRCVAAIQTNDPQPPLVYTTCKAWAAHPALAGVALGVGRGMVPATWGDPTEWTEALDGTALRGTISGFSQAHDAVNAELTDCVLRLAQPAGKRVLELYAGAGNFTVALAQSAATLVAVEQDPAAAQACRDNLRARHLKGKVLVGDAAVIPQGDFDVALLDPPRAGAGATIDALVARRIPHIAYVSCDTATLERDIGRAVAANYTVDQVFALDMFPNTAHVETVVRLVALPREER